MDRNVLYREFDLIQIDNHLPCIYVAEPIEEEAVKKAGLFVYYPCFGVISGYVTGIMEYPDDDTTQVIISKEKYEIDEKLGCYMPSSLMHLGKMTLDGYINAANEELENLAYITWLASDVFITVMDGEFILFTEEKELTEVIPTLKRHGCSRIDDISEKELIEEISELGHFCCKTLEGLDIVVYPCKNTNFFAAPAK